METVKKSLGISIYRVFVENDELFNKCYIGSTKKRINQRLSEHKSSFLSPKTLYHNSTYSIFEYAFKNKKNVKIEVLEYIEYDNEKDEKENLKYFCEKENEFINKYKEYVVNKRKAKR